MYKDFGLKANQRQRESKRNFYERNKESILRQQRWYRAEKRNSILKKRRERYQATRTSKRPYNPRKIKTKVERYTRDELMRFKEIEENLLFAVKYISNKLPAGRKKELFKHIRWLM